MGDNALTCDGQLPGDEPSVQARTNRELARVVRDFEIRLRETFGGGRVPSAAEHAALCQLIEAVERLLPGSAYTQDC